MNNSKTPWWKSKYAVAAHIALVYIGVSYYVQVLVKQEQQKRNSPTPSPSLTTPKPHKDDDNRATNEISNDDLRDIKGASFGALASEYDDKLKWDEYVMGLNLFRRYLLSHAKGNILEIACGTGRNIPYFPSPKKSSISSLTFIDASCEMLSNAKAKFDQHKKRFERDRPFSFMSLFTPSNDSSSTSDFYVPSRFIQMNASKLEFEDDYFDTVIDTFGLCSIGTEHGPNCVSTTSSDIDENPICALNEMARVCKPDGKVLLLEHGIGTWSFINNQLNGDQVKHFVKWGCWWNRDVLNLIKQSNLEIEYVSR